MNSKLRFPILALVVAPLLIAVTGCHKLLARNELNKGVQAYKNAQYERAINHFEQAVNYDPKLPMANAYLATAYAQQVVPDLQTPENLKTANLAINGFKKVLEESPKDTNAIKGIASIYFNIDKYAEAKQWQLKALATDPQDAVAAYTIGSIDWRVAFRNATEVLHDNHLVDDGAGNVKLPKKACEQLASENKPIVNEGLQYLQRAIQLRPNYDDAMAYMQLTYRRQADFACGDKAALAASMALADQWRQKAMDTRKANEEAKRKATGGGVTLQ